MKKRGWSLSPLGVFLIILWVFLCFYVFLYCKLVAIGYKMEMAKKQYDELTMLNRNYKAKILSFSSPENLLKMAKSSGINLINPSKWCYIDIREDKVGAKFNETAEAGTE